MKKIFFMMVLGYSASINAQQVVSLSTGVVNNSTSFISLGSNDDTWTVTLPDNSVVTPKVCNTYSGWGSNSCSKWITSNIFSNNATTAPVGTIKYKTTFNLTSLSCVSGGTINFSSLGGDNKIQSIQVNTTTHTLNLNNGSSNNNFNPLTTNLSISVARSEFVSGTNTITINLYNENIVSGLNACGDLTINVQNNNPSFALSSSFTPGNSYFTCFATPTLTTLPPNAGYYWGVDEIVSASDQTVISGKSASNPSCWWNGSPYTSDFHGYDGSRSTVMDPACSNPTPGRFTTGHTYRITRGTWSDVCDWAQYSVIVYLAPGKGNGQQVVVLENVIAPDMSAAIKQTTGIHSLTSENNLSVYPNPSKGEFVIHTLSEKGSIDVYDMKGSKVQTIELKANTTSYKLDLSGFGKGVYLIHLISGEQKSIQKVIVE